MKKDWYKSVTVWGAVLMGLSYTLDQLGALGPEWAWAGKAGQGLGAVLSIWGFRRTQK